MAEIVKMKCSECGGAMDINSNREVICCPFCGSKNLIVESDYVKVEKEKLKTSENIERIKSEEKTTKAEYLLYIGMFAFLFLMILLVFLATD